jgi:hypothetical protein
MKCEEFLAGFSDFFDRGSDLEDGVAFAEHLASCESCRRYERVVRGSIHLLRTLPTPEVTDDFRPRLQHRLYHVADEEGLARGTSSGSGTTAATALAMAVLLVVVAWSPSIVGGDPEIQLPVIVVNEPAPRPEPPPVIRSVFTPADFQERPLWNHSHSLLYEYSTLSERSRSSVLRTGLD